MWSTISYYERFGILIEYKCGEGQFQGLIEGLINVSRSNPRTYNYKRFYPLGD